MFLPDMLAARDGTRQLRAVGRRIHHVVMAVGCQTEEDREEERGSSVEDVPGSRFREALSHHRSFPVWLMELASLLPRASLLVRASRQSMRRQHLRVELAQLSLRCASSNSR